MTTYMMTDYLHIQCRDVDAPKCKILSFVLAAGRQVLIEALADLIRHMLYVCNVLSKVDLPLVMESDCTHPDFHVKIT